MTPKQKTFIETHLPQYGYSAMAANRTLWEVEQPSHAIPVFTLNQHERYAYNNNHFQFRDSPNSVFTVEFGKPIEAEGGIAEAYDAGLIHIADTFGRIGIPHSDLILSQGLRQACRRLGIDFVEVVLDLEGHPGFLSQSFGPQQRVQVSLSEYLDFAERFGRVTLCREPLNIYRAIFSEISDLPMIYSSIPPHLSNENYDRYRHTRVGPDYWVLRSNENEYAIHRWLHYLGKRGVPDFYSYTPNMLREWFSSDGFRSFIRNHDDDTACATTGNTPTVIESILPDAFRVPSLARVHFYEHYFGYETNFEQCRVIDNHARDRAHKAALETTKTIFYSHHHHIPLHRLLDHLGIDYDFPHGKYDEIYGPVE